MAFELNTRACRKLQPGETNSVDWIGIGLSAASLAATTVVIVGVARAGIKRVRNRPTRRRKAKGESQPPEPPEGRYWG